MLKKIVRTRMILILLGVVVLAMLIVLFSDRWTNQSHSDSQVDTIQKAPRKADEIQPEMGLDANSAVAVKPAGNRAAQQTMDESLVNRFDDPQALIKGYMHPSMSYDLLRACIRQDEIPQLHQMLNDEEQRKYWPVIATVIGLVSEEEGSVPVLVDYFKRDDTENLDFLDHLVMKANIPQHLGKIGGSQAEKTLRQLYVKEELEKAIGKWIDSESVNARWPSKERLIAFIRGGIAYGLIYLQDPEAYEFVKKRYEDGLIAYKQTKVATPLWNNLVYAMGLKDCIDEIGLDEMLSLKYEEKMKVTRAYMYKYGPHLRRKEPAKASHLGYTGPVKADGTSVPKGFNRAADPSNSPGKRRKRRAGWSRLPVSRQTDQAGENQGD